MRNDRRVIAAICCIVLGAVLLVLGMMEMVDEFWSGMGGALIAVEGHVNAYYISESLE